MTKTKIYYNIQLLSSFLLDKTRILFIFLLILLNGNNIFSLILCEEQIDTLSTNQEEDVKQNNNTKWYIGIALAVGIGLILTYLYFSGGGDTDAASSLLTKPKNQNINQQESPEAAFRIYENIIQGSQAKNQVLKTENATLSWNNENLDKQARANFLLAKGFVLEYSKCNTHIIQLEDRQATVYNFIIELFVKNPEKQEEIIRFMRENPPIAPYGRK